MLIAAAAMAAMSGQPATCMFAMASSLETETSRWWLIWCRNEYVTLGGGSCSRDQEINAPPKPLFTQISMSGVPLAIATTKYAVCNEHRSARVVSFGA